MKRRGPTAIGGKTIAQKAAGIFKKMPSHLQAMVRSDLADAAERTRRHLANAEDEFADEADLHDYSRHAVAFAVLHTLVEFIEQLPGVTNVGSIPAPLATRASALDGACFDPTTVVHVDFDFNGGQPFSSIQQAVDAFPDGGEGVIVVHEALEHAEIVNVTGGRTIAIIGAPGESPEWLGTESPGPHLSVTGASTVVFLDRMTLTSNYGLDGAAVQAETGRLHIQRSAIVNNDGGAIELSSAAYAHVENSFVGGDVSDEIAIEVTNADATILYSTVLSGPGASSRSLSCTNAGVVDARNSILLGDAPDDSVQCSGATFLNNASDQGLGLGNVTLLDFGTAGGLWFSSFADGDFHLYIPINFCLVAVWETGDPAIDIDGDSRPNVNATSDCARADVP